MFKIILIILALIGLVGTTTHYAFANNMGPADSSSSSGGSSSQGPSDTTTSPGGGGGGTSNSPGSDNSGGPWSYGPDAAWHNGHPGEGGFLHRYFHHHRPATGFESIMGKIIRGSNQFDDYWSRSFQGLYGGGPYR